MSSSDSDDDCYGNAARRLQQIKNTLKSNVTERDSLNDSTELSQTSQTLSKPDVNTSEITIEDCNGTVSSTDNDEYTLDAIIAKNSKIITKKGRGGKRKTSEASPGPAQRITRSSRRKTVNSTRGRGSSIDSDVSSAPVEANSAPIDVIVSDAQNDSSSVRSRRRGGPGRGARARGRPRGAQRGRGRTRRELWSYFDTIFGVNCNSDSQSNHNIPTYSVGNTDEYPDQSDNQQLFSTRSVNNDIQIIEDDDPLNDDNEELSVKVYWQNLEVFKFKIRKYQKLTQIFDYFAEKEGVNNDKLLFMYNDRILKIDDSPDSINYSIAKFIDGGIVNQNVTALVKTDCKKNINNGLKIKFQCQDKKKAFETRIGPHDKLGLAMMKCAEHLETPLERLKFYFDGDVVHNKATPSELDLEGGECIDVKISS